MQQQQKEEPEKVSSPITGLEEKPPELIKEVRATFVDVICEETGVGKKDMERIFTVGKGFVVGETNKIIQVLESDSNAEINIPLGLEGAKNLGKIAGGIEKKLNKELKQYKYVSVRTKLEGSTITITVKKQFPKIQTMDLPEETI